MKWKKRYEDYETSQVGHLYCYIRGNSDEKYFNWFIAPDDEDKNYRRAVEDGTAESMEQAKVYVEQAVRKIATDLVSALEEA